MLEEGGRDERTGDLIWLPIKIKDEMKQCRFGFHEMIFGNYESDVDKGGNSQFETEEEAEAQQAMYKKHSVHASHSSIFRGVDRINIILNIIGAPINDGGCDLKPRDLLHKKVLCAFYPLHDYFELNQVSKVWIRSFYSPKNQPINLIRDYFGEKIALYFSWLGMYTMWLFYASIGGVITHIFIVAQGYDVNSVVIVFFAVFMAGWSTVYLEKWKVKEVRTALKYGMIGFEEEETERPEFEGTFTKSPIDGKELEYFKDSKRGALFLNSLKVIVGLCILVLGLLAGMLTVNYYLNGGKHGNADIPGNDDGVYEYDDGGVVLRTGGYSWGMILVFFLQALLIELGGGYFTDIAAKLTDEENHKTDTNYEDALVLKSFVFNFINSYTGLFYIGFLAKLTGQPCSGPDGKDNCMSALNIALGTIFVSRLVVGNIQEVIVPLVNSYLKARENQLDEEDQERLLRHASTVSRSSTLEEEEDETPAQTAIEEQYCLDDYDASKDLYGDYLEMCLQVRGCLHYPLASFCSSMSKHQMLLFSRPLVQFGYATLFATSFTLAPLMAAVNNYVEIRVDAWKIAVTSKRPFPQGAEDIGQWQTLLEFMSTLQIISNTALVLFISEVPWFEGLDPKSKLIMFIVIEHFAFGLKILIGTVMDDVPEEVEIQIDRQDLYRTKLVDNEQDEQSELNEAMGKRPKPEPPILADFCVHESDTEWIDRAMRKKMKAERGV